MLIIEPYKSQASDDIKRGFEKQFFFINFE